MTMIKYKLKALIFDFDLTLVDTLNVYTKVVEELKNKHGLDGGNINIVKEAWGRTTSKNAQFLEKLNNKKLPWQEIEGLITHYATHHSKDVEIREKDFLIRAKNAGMKLAIVSHTTQDRLDQTLDNNANDNILFDVVLGQQSKNEESKAKKIIEILERLDIKKNEAIYIGDHINDISAAKEAGTLSCAVCSGFHNCKDFVKFEPDIIIDDLSELKDYIDI
jgi:phosphoglycolate phosphatase